MRQTICGALLVLWACEPPAQPVDQLENEVKSPSPDAAAPLVQDGGTLDGAGREEAEEEEEEEEKKADGDPVAPAKDASPSGETKTCKTSFARDVLPAFDQAGCGTTFCHGTRFAPKIRIEVGDANITYGELTTYKLGGKPYVKPMSTNPDDSTIACHLSLKCGIKMPPGNGSIPASFQTIVRSWLACGAPKN